MKNTLFKKGLVVGIIILFVGVGVIPSNAVFLNDIISTDDEVFSIPMDSRGIIYVDDDNTGGPWDGTLGHPYQYIQDGVDNAGKGDMVYVFNGTYYECIVIGKSSLKLVGENVYSTIIDGKGCNSVILIGTNSNYVHICKFTIKNGNYGIRCYSDYNQIYKNNIFDNNKGIDIYNSNHCKVFRNYIHNNRGGGITIMGTLNIITNNDIRNSSRGILTDTSYLGTIEKNNFINNTQNAFFIQYHRFGFSNKWKRNYWDDWGGIGPQLISGRLVIFNPDNPYYPPKYFDLRNYDWFPAKKPYKIIITNNIEGCGIE